MAVAKCCEKHKIELVSYKGELICETCLCEKKKSIKEYEVNITKEELEESLLDIQTIKLIFESYNHMKNIKQMKEHMENLKGLFTILNYVDYPEEKIIVFSFGSLICNIVENKEGIYLNDVFGIVNENKVHFDDMTVEEIEDLIKTMSGEKNSKIFTVKVNCSSHGKSCEYTVKLQIILEYVNALPIYIDVDYDKTRMDVYTQAPDGNVCDYELTIADIKNIENNSMMKFKDYVFKF